MTSTYKHDYIAFDRLVLCAGFMVEEMEKRGIRVKVRAEATAAYYADDPDLVHYRDNFFVESGIRETPTRRAYCRIGNTDMPTALFTEFGTVHNPRRRTLGNALDAAGD